MKDHIAGTFAVAGLTLREASRQKLWLLVLLAMAVVLVAVPGLDAVDDAARMKLGVATVSGVIGFITTLLAILMVASTVRRDLEQRTGFMLFAKPLPRLAYCLGRWLGTLAALLLAVSALTLVGSLAMRLQLGHLPAVRSTVDPGSVALVDALGAVTPLRDDERRVQMGQGPGSGVRVTFTGLRREAGEHELLVKALIRGDGVASGLRVTPVTAQVLAPGGATDAAPLRLALADGSPYGTSMAPGEAVPEGAVVLRHRDLRRRDLGADYLRLLLPSSAIAEDGSLTVEFLRRRGTNLVLFDRESSFFIARADGSFTVELFKTGLVSLARAGVLASLALAMVALSGVGTALLACLTVWFGGNAVGVIAESLRYGELSVATERILTLIMALVPDFGRFPLAAELAGSHVVGWGLVAGGWAYFGIWIVAFGVVGWIIMARREL